MIRNKHILLITILMAFNLNLSAWTSSNEGVCYTMDTLCMLSDSISYNQVDQRFEVACDIIILENDTLRINPGEYLYFVEVFQPPSNNNYYGIKIFGTLLCIGQIDNFIYLGDKNYNISNGFVWCGIKFINTSQNGESIIKNCQITGAMNVLGSDFTYDGDVGIFCENSSPIIDHCNFSYMFSDYETGGGSAIACKGQSYPIISYCKFEHLYNSIAIWCNPWYTYDTINYPSPLVLGCNILSSVSGFFFWPIDNDVIIYRGGFMDNCYLGVNNYSADTTLGNPIDTVGDGICSTNSTFWKQRFMEVDGVVNPRGDTLLTGMNETEIVILPTTSQHLMLNNCYPNPFDNFTTIEFELKEASTNVVLIVLDSKGNRVKTLINKQPCILGLNQEKWFGDNDTGQKVIDGIYFYKLTANDQILVKKAIIKK